MIARVTTQWRGRTLAATIDWEPGGSPLISGIVMRDRAGASVPVDVLTDEQVACLLEAYFGTAMHIELDEVA